MKKKNEKQPAIFKCNFCRGFFRRRLLLFFSDPQKKTNVIILNELEWMSETLYPINKITWLAWLVDAMRCARSCIVPTEYQCVIRMIAFKCESHTVYYGRTRGCRSRDASSCLFNFCFLLLFIFIIDSFFRRRLSFSTFIIGILDSISTFYFNRMKHNMLVGGGVCYSTTVG